MLRTRCIVAGTRTFDDYYLLVRKLVHIFNGKGLEPKDVEIISGGAEGADSLGEKFANVFKEYGLKLTVMEAEWEKRGNSAGHVRNVEMGRYARVNGNGICVCFWDGKSSGTAGMMEIAESYELDLYVVRY